MFEFHQIWTQWFVPVPETRMHKKFPLGKFRSAHKPKYGTVHTIKEPNFIHFAENCYGYTCDTPNCREFSVESYSSIEQVVSVVGEKLDHFKYTKVNFPYKHVKCHNSNNCTRTFRQFWLHWLSLCINCNHAEMYIAQVSSDCDVIAAS